MTDLQEPSVVETATPPRVVIVTGMSGSGKSTALRALEDAGFFCIDNMPVPLLPKVLELAAQRREGRATQPYAFVVDTRDRDFLDRIETIVDRLIQEGVHVQILFLEADDDTLVRRYSETRRRHPLSDGGTVRDGIAREREALATLGRLANFRIDTTRHTVHTLKAWVREHIAEVSEDVLQITILSFGFKYGPPLESDIMLDVRFLPNPYFVEDLRPRTGLEPEVADYVLSFPEATRLVDLFQSMLEFVLPQYAREGKSYLTVSLGCTGGRHRSVAIAETLLSRLRGLGWRADVRHRDVER